MLTGASFKSAARRFWWVLPILLTVVTCGWICTQRSRVFVITWHDPRVQVEVLGVSHGVIHTSPNAGGVKNALHRLLRQIGFSSLVPTNASRTITTRSAHSILWIALTPNAGDLTPDRDRVTLVRPNGRRTSWTQTRGQVVHEGDVYLMTVGIDEGVESVKGSSVEIIVGWRKRAVIEIH